MKISFLGDICFNNEYNDLHKKGINPFAEISVELKDSDLVVGNLESLCISKDGFNPLRPVKLFSEEATLSYLKNLNIDLVTLATNHVYDNLQDGFQKTIDYLNNNSILYLGAWLKNDKKRVSYMYEREGIKILLLNYINTDTNPTLPEDSPIILSLYNKTEIIQEIKNNRRIADFIVLLFHWGGRMEGGIFPDKYQIKDSEEFIEQGADLIIGHHSHTFQPYESVNGKHIFYSLGDFCSDNVYKGGRRLRVRSESGIVNVTFSKNAYSLDIIPIMNEKLTIKYNYDFLPRLKYRNQIFLLMKIRFFWFLNYTFLKIVEPVLFYFFGYRRNFISKVKDLNFNKFKIFIRSLSNHTSKIIF